jgi:hypothetical protein
MLRDPVPGDLLKVRRRCQIFRESGYDGLLGAVERDDVLLTLPEVHPRKFSVEVRVLHPSYGPCYINGSAVDVIDENR